MLHLREFRIGDFFELQSLSDEEKNRVGKVYKIGQRQILINSRWFNLDRITPINITEDILLHAGFKHFNWLTDSPIFECNYFKCTLDDNGINLFGDNLKNLKPIKYLHELQNLYFDLTREELEVDINYIESAKTEMV